MKTELKLTPKQLSRWNYLQSKLGGISFNENINEAEGLPGPAERAFLSKLHSERFGFSDPSAPLPWAYVKSAFLTTR